MTELTNELISELGLTYRSASSTSENGWKFIESELSDYDEGTTYYTYVYQNIETGEYWQFTQGSNSWCDYEDDDFYPQRVVPKEVTVTVYVPLDA